MNVDDIEALIRKYLSTGMAVIVILVAPGTGADAAAVGGPPSVTAEPDSTAPPDGAGEREPAGPADSTEPFRDPPPAEPEPVPAEPVPDEPAEPSTGETEELPDYEPPRNPPPQDSAAEEHDEDTAGESDPSDTAGVPEDPDARRAPTDAGPAKAGPEDAGPADAGPEDAGPEDAGPEDAGPAPDDDADAAPADAGDVDPDLDGRGPASAEPGIDETEEPATDDPTAEGPSAAETHGWGAPDREDEFTEGSTDWDVYEGPGHAGEGVRSPDALTIEDGDILVITGDASGTTGGLSWGQGQQYGRWEARVRAPESDPGYNALLLLWPDAENFPLGGEIDFMEMLDPTRQTTDFFLHHGEDDEQVNAQVRIDGTQWHNWAVEWTPDAIVGYVDGEEWFRNTDPSTFPPGPMHLCIQLDWFPQSAGAGTGVQESRMEVDRVRQWSLDAAPEERDDPTTVAPARAGGSDGPIVDAVRRLFSWS